MKNAKLIVLLSCLIAVVLLACCFIFPFTRSVEAAWTNMISVEFNDSFDAAEVEKAVREAGASDVLVLKQVTRKTTTVYEDGTGAEIYFTVPAGTEAKTVFDKAEELLSQTYAFKYPGTLNVLSTTLTKQTILSFWPTLIVLVVLLAYAFVRFDVQTGLMSVVELLLTGAATAGVLALARVNVSAYTLAALFGTAVLSQMFVFVFAFLKRDYAKKAVEGAPQLAAKKVAVLAVVLCCMAICALVLTLILGNGTLKGFALAALIGTAFNACAAVFTLPALASVFGQKAN